MAVAGRGGRGGGSSLFGGFNGGLRSFFSYRIFVSAMFFLLFLATLSVLLTSHPSTPPLHHSSLPSTGNAYVQRTFLALQSDPLKTRLDLIQKQASDHMTLLNAYASYARRLKLDISKQLKVFDDLAKNLTDLTLKNSLALFDPENSGSIDEDSLRVLEKEVKEKVKTTRMIIAEAKESYDNQVKIQKLKDTIFAVNEQLVKARKGGALASAIAARSVPKSLHCLAMRLVEERVSHPEKYREEDDASAGRVEFEDPGLFHYVIFSDNVIAVSVVVRSVVKNAEEPWRHVFHLVANRMNVAAMRVWFRMRPVEGGAHVEIKALEDFGDFGGSGSTGVLPGLEYLRFYLPEMYPKLRKVLYLDDDVVVQKDLTGLWKVDLDGKINGAVETCFGSFHRFMQYLNFSSPLIREKFNPRACAWSFGMNVFDLDAWRREKLTEKYHYWQNLNADGTLWNSGTLAPGLVTFYLNTKSLDKSWHVLGLGYNPSISMDEINKAAVIHYNGNMKPWLDIAMNQYKSLWTKYVDMDMEFIQMCNFGL